MNWLAALGIVFLLAALGALISGNPDEGPYSTLNKPSFTPTLEGWLIVAAVYYAGMTAAVARLLHRRHRPSAMGTLLIVVAVLVLNELWNIFLFRLGRADLAFVSLIPFSILVAVAAWRSKRVDRVSASILAAYLLWLGFDLVWAYRLAALN